MAFQVISLQNVSQSRDWTQQELAEFYRVESILGSSGIRVATDRGLSDEGDPWFVFCHSETHDIVIHFARFDGFYIAASPAFGCALRGRSFRDLIDAFIAKQPVAIPNIQSSSDVVVLHPSAFLSALVATALLLLSHHDAEAASLPVQDMEDRPVDGQDHRFTKLLTTLVEPLLPDEQRLALIAIGAIVAGLTAATYDMVNETASVSPLIETEQATQESGAGDVVSSDNREDLFQVTSKTADIQVVAAICDTSASSSVSLPELDVSENLFKASIVDPDLVSLPSDGLFAFISKESPSVKTHEDASLDLDRLSLKIAAQEDSTPNKILRAHQNAPAGTELVAGKADEHVETSVKIDVADKSVQESMAALLAKSVEPAFFAHSNGAENITGLEAIQLDLQSFVAMSNGQSSIEIGQTMFDVSISSEENISGQTDASDAISDFTKKNPDFKLAKLGRDVVLIDLEIRGGQKYMIDIHSWSFTDGSKIMIIGSLPEQA